MALDLSSISGLFMNWMFTGLWILVAAFLVIGSALAALIIRKKKRLSYPIIELLNVGNGKIVANITKAGWFKRYKVFFGLLDKSGEQEFCLKDGRKVRNMSTHFYQTINGTRGAIVKRKDDDPDIVVPIEAVNFKGDEILANIAPADYRDAAVMIIEEKISETMKWFEKYGHYIVLPIIAIILLIMIIFVCKFTSGELNAAREFTMQIVKNGGCAIIETAKQVASSAP